jgi:spore coat protein U-like protein
MKIPETIITLIENETENLRFGSVTATFNFRENRMTHYEVTRKKSFVPEFDGGTGKNEQSKCRQPAN